MKLIDKIIAGKKAAATANKAVKSSAATKIAIGTALAAGTAGVGGVAVDAYKSEQQGQPQQSSIVQETTTEKQTTTTVETPQTTTVTFTNPTNPKETITATSTMPQQTPIVTHYETVPLGTTGSYRPVSVIPPKDTTKQTTTTTITHTTTTKPTTQKPTQPPTQPVTQTPTQQPTSSEYTLDDIRTNGAIFDNYANKLNSDLLKGHRYTGNGNNETYGGLECKIALLILNDGNVTDEVIKEVFKGYTVEDLQDGINYVNDMLNMQNVTGGHVTFSNYTLDKEIGSWLDRIDSEYRNGNIDSFLNDLVNVGIAPDRIYDSAAVMAVTASYDLNNKYLQGCDAEAFGERDIMERVAQVALGTNYKTKTYSR